MDRPASVRQALAKIIYGNPFKPVRARRRPAPAARPTGRGAAQSVMTVRQEKEHLGKLFRKFDIDGDGCLTIFEFSLLANALGREMYPIQVWCCFDGACVCVCMCVCLYV